MFIIVYWWISVTSSRCIDVLKYGYIGIGVLVLMYWYLCIGIGINVLVLVYLYWCIGVLVYWCIGDYTFSIVNLGLCMKFPTLV